MNPARKLLSHEQTDDWIASERALGHRIGFTCGSFDLLHPGHVQYLARARELCDRLLVAVNTDASVQRYKSPLRPINPEKDRQYLIAGLESVDAVTFLDENRPLNLLLRWKPDLYIKGGDYNASSLKSGDAVRAYGGRVEVIRPEFSTSSTGTIERIAALAAHAAPERVTTQPDAGLVLLDRDGTLIRNIPFLHDPAGVELLPGVAEGLARLNAAGLRLAVASNQQGIGLGYFTMQEFIAVNQRMFSLLAPAGVAISRVYYCPHSLADNCTCRKPRAGMLERAMRDFATPPERTFFVGDSGVDTSAALAAGCAAVFVGPAAAPKPGAALPAFTAPDFTAAVDWILSRIAIPAGGTSAC